MEPVLRHRSLNNPIMPISFSWPREACWFALTTLVGVSLAAAPLQIISTLDNSTVPTLAGGGDSSNPFLSADGRYVLFASTACNLALTGSNLPMVPTGVQRLNVYLRDRTNGTTTLVSANYAGTGGGNGDSVPAGLSLDGRYALFESWANDILPGDTNNASRNRRWEQRFEGVKGHGQAHGIDDHNVNLIV